MWAHGHEWQGVVGERHDGVGDPLQRHELSALLHLANLVGNGGLCEEGGVEGGGGQRVTFPLLSITSHIRVHHYYTD